MCTTSRRPVSHVHRAPIAWAVAATVVLVGVALDAYVRHEVAGPFLTGTLIIGASLVITTILRADANRAAEKVITAMTERDAYKIRRIDAVAAEVHDLAEEVRVVAANQSAMLGAVGPEAVDRRITRLDTTLAGVTHQLAEVTAAVEHLAGETNAAGYQLASLPSAITTKVDAQRTDAYLAGVAAAAARDAAADTKVFEMPPQWRRGA